MMEDGRNRSKPVVVIVGAGMSGLSAAVHLINNGIQNIHILEASERLGGRMNTVSVGGEGSRAGIVELGANWIHGAALSHSVYSFAASHRLLDEHLILERMRGYCYRPDGRVINKDLTEMMWGLFQVWEAESEHEQYSHLKNLNRYYQFRLHGALQSQIPPHDHENAKCVFNCLLNYSRFHEGIPLSEVQLTSGHVYIPGGNVMVPSGMVTIIQKLADGVPSGMVKINHRVVEIDWTNPNMINVFCSNGKRFACDHVICTISLGCLKACHRELFVPMLPAVKSDAIDRFGFGCVNKIFLYYKDPFWVPGHGGIKLAWDDKEAQPSSLSEWYKRIFAFDEVLNNPNILVAWISGPEAAHMETLSDVDIMDTCTCLLRRFLSNPTIPYPLWIIHSNWKNNPFTRGSYSGFTVSSVRGDQSRLAMPLWSSSSGGSSKEIPSSVSTRDPVRGPQILFAGEATSPDASSTMHGARNSGIREAERIIAAYKSVNQSKL